MAYEVRPTFDPPHCHFYAVPLHKKGAQDRLKVMQNWRKEASIKKFRENNYSLFEKDLGHRMPEHLFERELIIQKGGKHAALNNSWGSNIVTQDFKDCHEAIAPNTNYFVEVKMHWKDGTPHEEQFYYFNILSVLDALNPILGGLKPYRSDGIYATGTDGYQIVSEGYEKLAVYADRIEGYAVWKDPRMSSRIFMSDACAEKMKAAGCIMHFGNYYHEVDA